MPDTTISRLLLLGAPELLRDGQVVPFRTRKALALLCYLATSPGPHPRERLLTLLWPAADERRGRANLRTALLYLRDALGPTADLLHATGDRIALASSSVLDVDLAALEAAHGLATAPASGDAGGAAARVPAEALIAQLARAAALYRGPFLDGLALPDAPEFEAWMEGQRAWWARRARAIYLRLAVLRREGGAPEGAAEVLEQWLGHEPGDEGAWQTLLAAYGAAGDATAVRAASARCRAALRATLDVAPDPRTCALAAATEDDALWGSAGLPPEDNTLGGDTPPPGTWPALTLPLVGRSRELAALRSAYTRAAAGRPTLALLLGQAGIGKTRLATELANWAAARGAMVLEGRAFAAGAGLPYAPLTAALRARLERENAPEDLLADVWLAELARLLPELRERYPDLPQATADPALGPARLFEAVARLLGALAGRGPLLLVLDDAQWADAGTRDLTHYLVRGWGATVHGTGTRVLLVVAARTEDVGTDVWLAEWLAALGGDAADGMGVATRLDLGPLERHDTMRLAAILSGSEEGTKRVREQDGGRGTAARLGEWLHARTGGQPFYLAETLRALLEMGTLALRAAPGGGRALDLAALDLTALQPAPPGPVQEAIRMRLGRLEGATVALLRAGATLGGSFGFVTACWVAALDEEIGLAALDEARLGLLLRETGDARALGAGARYAFEHDLVREVVYQEAGEARRAMLHRRALAALQGEGAPAAELARHALAAAEGEAAVRYSVRAGDDSLAVFAIQDGITHYERARGLLERGAMATAEEIVRLYANLGRAYDAAGEQDAARAAYEALLRAARASEPTLAAEAFNLYLARDGLRLDEARALLDEALPLAARADSPAAEAEMRLNVAQVALVAWNLDVAAREATRAREAASARDLAELEGRSLYLLALVTLRAGRLDESRALCVDARAIFRALAERGAGTTPTPPLHQLWARAPWSPPWSREARLRGMEAQCLALLANIEVNRGEAAAGRAAGYAGLQLAEEAHDDWGWAYVAVSLTLALVESGDYAEAQHVAGRAREITHALPNTNLRSKVPLEAGALHLALLDLARTRATTLEALPLMGPEATASQLWRVLGLSRLCATHALSGEWDEAIAYARAAAEARARMGTEPLPIDFARHYEMEALLRDGDREAARRGVAQLAARIGAGRRHRLVLTRMQAALAHWEGDAAGALGHLEDALELAAGMGLPGERWAILAEMAALRRERGEAAEAARAVTEARAIVEELAARLGDTGQGRDFRARALAHIAGAAIVPA